MRYAALCFTLPLLALSGFGCARHYPVYGMVLRVDAGKNSVLVSHRDIPGYMKAMAMPFRVRDRRELAGLVPGARIDFDLAVGKRESYARRIRIRKIDDGGLNLQKPPEAVAVGQALPDFMLTDQRNRPLRLSELRGQVVCLDFIYTRCPLPEVCPRLSANFARLQRRFPRAGGKDLVLVSVTLDPKHDTPAVLADYGKIWGANPEQWKLLTGAVDEVRAVAASFGVIYWPEEGTLAHSSQTAVIGRDGKLAGLVEGSEYAVSQLGDLIVDALEKKND